jgi:molybdopterin molybdotransferase
MKAFFQVLDIDTVLGFKREFPRVATEVIPLEHALGRVLAADIVAEDDIPGFDRATMDGYAVQAASTFGASESNPAYLTIVGSVRMGRSPRISVGPGQAARIATGGMLPEGADCVVMVEYTESVDDTTVEVHRSLAPGQHVILRNEDVSRGQAVLNRGRGLRAQEVGLLAACGQSRVSVFRRPRIAIISTGDEVVAVDQTPRPGQIRDVNSYALAALVRDAGAEPIGYGIVGDRYGDLLACCRRALEASDMVLISGGSSVGMRDLTLDALEALEESRILVHGISIRPGKPTILARCGEKPFWGLPGHVASAMVVFMVVVRPFVDHLCGRSAHPPVTVRALLSRNLASVQGRVGFVRVRLAKRDGAVWAEPILGQSGLIHTMVAADGLIAIGMNSEGLEKGATVDVRLI